MLQFQLSVTGRVSRPLSLRHAPDGEVHQESMAFSLAKGRHMARPFFFLRHDS